MICSAPESLNTFRGHCRFTSPIFSIEHVFDGRIVTIPHIYLLTASLNLHPTPDASA